MNILLPGASGFVGRHIAAALCAEGHHVVPVSRHSGTDFSRMLSVADWLPHLERIDAVINAAGIISESGRQRFDAVHTRAPSALFHACRQAGVRRVLQLSALGADASAFSAFHLSKRAADDTLRSLDLEWFVLRPSLIHGRGGKSAELFMRLARLPRLPVIGDGQQRLQPVHISDVVATVIRGLTSADTRQTLDIVGTETITFAGWLRTLRRVQGLPPARLFSIPVPLAMALARAGRYVNPLLQVENLRMLQAGCQADFRPLARFLGRRPVSADTYLMLPDAASIRSPS